MTRRPAGRLSRERIVETAREVADRRGLEALTLRELAKELDTGQASLYRHIADRRELLTLLADDVATGFPRSDRSLPPRERLERVWLDMFGYLSEHRWAAEVIVRGDLVSEHAVPYVEDQLACLADLGLDREQRGAAYRALFTTMLGYLINDHPFGHHHETPDPDPGLGFPWAMRALLTGLEEVATKSSLSTAAAPRVMG